MDLDQPKEPDMLDLAPESDHWLQCRSFSSAGGTPEHYIAITAPPGLDLSDALDYILARYREGLQ